MPTLIFPISRSPLLASTYLPIPSHSSHPIPSHPNPLLSYIHTSPCHKALIIIITTRSPYPSNTYMPYPGPGEKRKKKKGRFDSPKKFSFFVSFSFFFFFFPRHERGRNVFLFFFKCDSKPFLRYYFWTTDGHHRSDSLNDVFNTQARPPPLR